MPDSERFPHSRWWPRALILLVLLGFSLWGGDSEARVIDNVDIDADETGVNIDIHFTTGLQYITHAPEKSGDVLQISLRSASAGGTGSPDLQGEEVINRQPSTRVPLTSIRYEGDQGSSPRLTLRFARPVNYEVRPKTDYRGILIRLIQRPVQKQRTPPRQSVTTGTGRAGPGRTSPVGNFALNLESALQPSRIEDLANLEAFKGLRLYITKIRVDGRTWHRLRLGFFATRKEAARARDSLKRHFPLAWITLVSAAEKHQALGSSAVGAPVTRTAAPEPPALPPLPEERVEALVEEARQAMAGKNYTRAVTIYTKLLQHSGHAYRRDALELLALARERKGQFAHARSEYRKFLELYPEGEGADRVRQRLAGLTTAAEKPKARLRTAGADEETLDWEVFGGFSQFFRRDSSTVDNEDAVITQSALSSELDVSGRLRTPDYDLRSRFTGGYLIDFRDEADGDDARINSVYLDAASSRLDVSGRVGRQSRSTGGVLGRFDGALASYQFLSWGRLNGVFGSPVESTGQSLNPDRYFYGLSFDLGTFANSLDFVAYWIEQQVDGLTDRRAIGGEVRYFHPNRSLLGLVDYDIFYESLNTFLLLGNWTLPNRLTLNAVVDYRNTPILTTNNALQGQTVNSVDGLREIFSDDQIRELARDRTARNRSFTLGASQPLTPKLQISGDVTVTNLADAPASGGVEESPGTGNEFFYSLQFIGNSLIKSGDSAILGFRYSAADTADISSVTINTRYPITSTWRINPRFRFDFRQNQDENAGDQVTLSPSVRMDYRWKRRMQFELEAGGQFSSRDLADDTEDTASYFLSIGYRADF